MNHPPTRPAGLRWPTVALAVAAVAALLLGTLDAAAADRRGRGGNHGGRGHGCVRALAGAGKVNTALADLVADGTITGEQRDAITAKLGQDAGRRVKACAGAALIRDAEIGPALAGLLGLDSLEILRAWRDGQSLAELAAAQGVDRAALVDTITAAIDASLAEAVANGAITEERKSEIMADLAPRIDEAVDAHRGDRRDAAATPAAAPAA